MIIKIVNKLMYRYEIVDTCTAGLSLKSYMILQIRKSHIQIHNSWIKNMMYIMNLFEEPVPILVLKHTQKKWNKLIKKHKLSVVIEKIMNVKKLIKCVICLVKNKTKYKKQFNQKQMYNDILDDYEQ